MQQQSMKSEWTKSASFDQFEIKSYGYLSYTGKEHEEKITSTTKVIRSVMIL